MADIRLTKDELRLQQRKLMQLEKYLPTLQLKKALLQTEIDHCRKEIDEKEEVLITKYNHVEKNSAIFTAKMHLATSDLVKIDVVHKTFENIAGVEVPYFESIDFLDVVYNLLDTPPWLESAIYLLRELVVAKTSLKISEEKKRALEKELRIVSIRVNLFEKILIPRAQKNIRKIKVFLGDQELAAVSRTKVAKGKIEKHRLELRV